MACRSQPFIWQPFIWHFFLGIFMAVLLSVTTVLTPSRAAASDRPFAAVTAAAKGQTVYFNAWGGDDKINTYIDWAGDQLADQFGIKAALFQRWPAKVLVDSDDLGHLANVNLVGPQFINCHCYFLSKRVPFCCSMIRLIDLIGPVMYG